MADVIDIDREAINRKSEAQKNFDKLKQVHSAFSKRSIEIGFYAYQMKSKNQFGILGFADESACREAIGIGRSTWYKMIKIAESFPSLSLADMTKVTIENLELLRLVDEEERTTAEWMESAEKMTEAEFEEKTTQYHAKKNGITPSEARVNLKVPMFTGQRKAVEEGVQKFQLQNGIKDPGQALEMLVVEAVEGESLSAVIRDTTSILGKALDLWSSGLSTEELVEQQHAAIENAVLKLHEAIGLSKRQEVA